MKKLVLLSGLLFFMGTGFLQGQIKVYPNTYVGIGSTSVTPASPVHISMGTMRLSWLSNNPLLLNTANADPRIQAPNNSKVVFYNTANNGWINIEVKSVLSMSDAKLKTNVRDIGEKNSALATIKQIKGVEFNYKDEPNGKKHAGLIAQDLEKILPHLVSTDDSLGYKLVDYQSLIPYLIEAVKEQQEQIDQLKQKLSISYLEGQYNDKKESKKPIRNEKSINELIIGLND